MTAKPVLSVVASPAIFQDYQVIPAKDKYPAKEQIKIIAGRTEFFLSSRTVSFRDVPLLVPCSAELHFTRVGGAKGFFVFEIESALIVPIVVESISAKVK